MEIRNTAHKEQDEERFSASLPWQRFGHWPGDGTEMAQQPFWPPWDRVLTFQTNSRTCAPQLPLGHYVLPARRTPSTLLSKAHACASATFPLTQDSSLGEPLSQSCVATELLSVDETQRGAHMVSSHQETACSLWHTVEVPK